MFEFSLLSLSEGIQILENGFVCPQYKYVVICFASSNYGLIFNSS